MSGKQTIQMAKTSSPTTMSGKKSEYRYEPETTMKTTELINGKTFDEVFAERGKEVKCIDMIVKKSYLCTNPELLNVIFDFCSLDKDRNVFSKHHVFQNGTFDNHNEESGVLTIEPSDYFYQATPNQIELLNMYINHEK